MLGPLVRALIAHVESSRAVPTDGDCFSIRETRAGLTAQQEARQNPTRQVHAVLGALCLLQLSICNILIFFDRMH